MDEIAHPLKAAHVPGFITPPGQTDTLLVIVGIFLILLIIGAGIVYFRLHALPEQMSHKGNNKAQFEIVAVLALLALFTHNNAFWVAALILAMIPLPDFMAPLNTMAGALTEVARSLWQRTAQDVGASPVPGALDAPESRDLPRPRPSDPDQQVKV
ncbi:MAG: hypothetical protein INF92_17590 [Rhodobacter sp.]|nr:hypothetical protein [Rhodobacter sp.]